MAKHDEYIIEQRKKDELWQVKKPHAERASAVEDTKKDAIATAKKFAPEGDIKVKGAGGKFEHIQRAKD
jgi:hypothetical protein